jgi:Ran GTPase-activating protein (RanGAP) involved in mRNA processing and transport
MSDLMTGSDSFLGQAVQDLPPQETSTGWATGALSVELSSQKLPTEKMQHMCTFLQSYRATTVRKVILPNCRIGASGAKALSNAIRNLENLQELNLCGNNIGIGGIKSLSEAFAMSRMEALENLDLSKNCIKTGGTKALSNAIQSGAVPNLTNLSLAKNNMCVREEKTGDQSVVNLVAALSHLTALQVLDLSSNHIHPAGAAALGGAFENNQTTLALEELDLSNNSVCGLSKTGDGMFSSAGILRILETLKGDGLQSRIHTLHLQANQICGRYQSDLNPLKPNLGKTTKGVHNADVVRGLKTVTTLTSLDLSHNCLGQIGAHDVIDALQQNKGLKTVNLLRTGMGRAGVQLIAEAKLNRHSGGCKNGSWQEGGDTVQGALHRLWSVVGLVWSEAVESDCKSSTLKLDFSQQGLESEDILLLMSELGGSEQMEASSSLRGGRKRSTGAIGLGRLGGRRGAVPLSLHTVQSLRPGALGTHVVGTDADAGAGSHSLKRGGGGVTKRRGGVGGVGGGVGGVGGGGVGVDGRVVNHAIGGRKGSMDSSIEAGKLGRALGGSGSRGMGGMMTMGSRIGSRVQLDQGWSTSTVEGLTIGKLGVSVMSLDLQGNNLAGYNSATGKADLAGLVALCDAIRSGVLVSLRVLNLADNNLGAIVLDQSVKRFQVR